MFGTKRIFPLILYIILRVINIYSQKSGAGVLNIYVGGLGGLWRSREEVEMGEMAAHPRFYILVTLHSRL
jgi:hypothetical protein